MSTIHPHPETGRLSKLLILVSLATFGALLAVLSPSFPLGIPGEWTWARRALLDIDPVAMVLAALLAAGYWWGAGRLIGREEAAQRTQAGSPWGPCLLALVWLGGMLLLFPEYHGVGRSPTVLYYKRTEGYFWQAAFEVQDSRQFLSSYRESISQGDDPDRYLHLGTHPPGLTLAYRGLMRLMERFPSLATAVTALEPPPIREALSQLREFPTPRGDQLRPSEEAALWAATLLTLLAAAATSWPIYRLAERIAGSVAATRAALLWPLVPSLLVFFPKSDLLCPVIATTSCWLWLCGWSRHSRWRCGLAGLGIFSGLMLTLALAPVALLLVIQTVLERWQPRRSTETRLTDSPLTSTSGERPATIANDVISVLCAVAGLAVPVIAVSLWGQCNLIAIWIENLRNHAMFYDHNSRSYWLWLVVNPLEAAFALGAPLTCLLVLGLFHIVSNRRERPRGLAQGTAWLVVWSMLWLSGKNMGEAARLWIFLAPWPVMTASTLGEDHRPLWRLALGLQLAICIVTVAIIDGFHFAELLPK